MAICFLIDSVAASADCAAARFARLRGARLLHCEDLDTLPGQLSQRSMIAISASRLRELSSRRKSQLANLVGEGDVIRAKRCPGLRHARLDAVRVRGNGDCSRTPCRVVPFYG
jgi:hypothetical protein